MVTLQEMGEAGVFRHESFEFLGGPEAMISGDDCPARVEFIRLKLL